MRFAINRRTLICSLLFMAVLSFSPSTLAEPTSAPPSGSVTPNFSTLVVDGNTTLSGDLSVGKAVTVSGSLGVLTGLNVTGLTTLETLKVGQSATFQTDVTINGNLTVQGMINGSVADGSTGGTGGGSSKVYESETAKISGAAVANTYSGYTGTGYVDYQNTNGDSIEWTVETTSAANYSLDFRYASLGSTSYLTISVNGIDAKNLDFPRTGSLTTWKTVGFSASLINGINKIRARTIGYPGPNLDHLSVWSSETSTNSEGHVQGDLTVTGQFFDEGLANLKKGAIISESLTVNGPASFTQPVSIASGGTASFTAILQGLEVGESGIFGGARTADGEAVYGAYLGYRDYDGMYSLYAPGISKMNDLVVENQLLTENVVSPTGILKMQGGVTAQNFGRFKPYAVGVASGATSVSASCANPTEIMISCGGVSTADNYKGSMMEGTGTSTDPLKCTSYRSTTSGNLYSFAYCFDPTVLP